MKKRGAWRRTSRSLEVVTSVVPSPTCAVSDQPRTVARHVVRLSGQVTVTVALPFASVSTSGDQKAVSAKWLRTGVEPPGAGDLGFGALILLATSLSSLLARNAFAPLRPMPPPIPPGPPI